MTQPDDTPKQNMNAYSVFLMVSLNWAVIRFSLRHMREGLPNAT